jgi:hypothetical protein
METVISTVRRLIELLAAREYDAIASWTNGIRLSSEEIRYGIEEYGRAVTLPPKEFYFRSIDVIRVTNSEPACWGVVFPLWTVEEGMSDLSVEITVTRQGSSNMSLELDNIRVR